MFLQKAEAARLATCAKPGQGPPRVFDGAQRAEMGKLLITCVMSYSIYILTCKPVGMQDPPVPAKQCCEEATPSVVEVMSKVEVSTPEEPLEESSQLLTPQEGSRRGESIGGGPETELKVFPDYVTLSRDGGSAGSKGNKYVPEQVGERRQLEDELHYSCTEESTCVQTCFVTDLLNQSYLPLAEDAPRGPAARGPGNLYTNLP